MQFRSEPVYPTYAQPHTLRLSAAWTTTRIWTSGKRNGRPFCIRIPGLFTSRDASRICTVSRHSYRPEDGVSIGIGMLAGMEREWSNKDVGVVWRTTKSKAVIRWLVLELTSVIAIGVIVLIFSSLSC